MSNKRHVSSTVRHLAAVLLAFCALACVDVAAAQTYSGSYDWSYGGSGSLAASFTPAGQAENGAPAWDVTYKFTFNGKDYTWKGTAEGALEEGASVSGTARGSRRDWVFNGTVKDGVLAGDHAEMKRSGKKSRSGTFSIKPTAAPSSSSASAGVASTR
ncbi:MAG: hypothetical protein AAFY88_10435 [Acidobacteriota bacterium]